MRKIFEHIGSSNPKNILKHKLWLFEGIVPLNVEIKQKIELPASIQEKLIGKSIDSIRYLAYGAEN